MSATPCRVCGEPITSAHGTVTMAHGTCQFAVGDARCVFGPGHDIDYHHLDDGRNVPVGGMPDTGLTAINVVFDGPPGPESGRFVEVETDDGKGVGIGQWIERADGYWSLRITAADYRTAVTS